MKYIRPVALFNATLTSLALGGCVAITSTSSAPSKPAVAGLGCTLISNCVNSVDNNGLPPLHYKGTSAQGLAALQATLATFPEARVVRSSDLAVEAVFTTSVGFRDDVAFRINPQAQQIDFRSQSVFGLYDFGKNRSRMQEFTVRFQQRAPQ